MLSDVFMDIAPDNDFYPLSAVTIDSNRYTIGSTYNGEEIVFLEGRLDDSLFCIFTYSEEEKKYSKWTI